MKAVLALFIIYIGTFLVVIQGASQNSVEASRHGAQAGQASVDPSKEADIRSLIELVGARDTLQDASARSTEQFRESLLASVPNNDRGQQFVNAFIDSYQKKFNPDEVAGQFVVIYDRHFSDDEIKALLQFYGSPLGQKLAAEMPKVNAEIQAANRAVSTRVAKDVLQSLRSQYPGIAGRARLMKPRAGQLEPASQQVQTQPRSQDVASHP
jgi:hypothetical protein